MNRSRLALIVTVSGLLPLLIWGASIPAKPITGDWLNYHGDYSGARYSPLTQIDRNNVGSLTLAWAAQLGAVSLKSTALEAQGVLYLTTADNVYALDARNGRTIWHYTRESKGDHYGHRGVGMYKDWLYFTTPDCHLVSLNAKDGTVRWDIEIADPKLGYFSSMSPLVVRDRLLVGVSGDLTNIPGFLDSRDPQTGKLQWRWYSRPGKGEPGSETWPKDTNAISQGGGMTWMTGTYDPDLNLIYWGIGNPNPVFLGNQRQGDNLYTDSIVALDPDSGKLKWYFQTTPHDTHDYDATQTPVLIDDTDKGAHRKLIVQANRNGFLFVLDRATGKSILTKPFVPTTWSNGIDELGRPRPRADMEPTRDGVLVSPGSFGATNWGSQSFDPVAGLFYISARRSFDSFYTDVEGQKIGWGGRHFWIESQSLIEGVDYRTGEVRWKHDIGSGESDAGILTTAGQILVTGDNNQNILVLDPATGKTLWHVSVGQRMSSSPMTYALDGRQYILTTGGGSVFTWKLPDSTRAPR